MPVIGGATSSTNFGPQGPTGWAVDPKAHGAAGDTVTVIDAAITSGLAILTSASAGFQSADRGKTVIVHGAGSGQIAAPAVTLGSASSGGFFTAGTYYWVVTALNKNGETVGSNEVSATLTNGQLQVVNWGAVAGATGYVVYRGTTAGGENTAAAYLGTVTTFTDIGVNSGFVFSPPAMNSTGATLVATISGWTSATQVTLSVNASTTVSGAEMSFGTDDTAALQTAIGTAIAATDLLIDKRYTNQHVRGGGRLIIPPGNYITSSVLLIPPRLQVDAYGATVVAAHTGSVIGFSTGGTFSGGGVRLSGLTIDGSNLAAVGLDHGLQTLSDYTDLTVYHCDVGVKSRGSQWSNYTNLIARDCGTTCLDIDQDVSGVQTADLVFTRCIFQNAPNCVTVASSTNVMFNGCSAQLAGYGGAGYLIKSGAVGVFVNGGHLEYNGFHVDIQSGAKGTVVVAPMGVLSCFRYVRNSGTNTQVFGMTAYSNTPVVKFNGSLAPLEQNTTNGDLTFYGQNSFTTGKLFVDETGTEYDPDTASVPTRMTWLHRDNRQSAATYWQTATFKSAANATAIATQLAADAAARFAVTTNGGLAWGGGSTATDNALLRIAANQMMLTSTLMPDAVNSRNLGTSALPWLNLFVGNAATAPLITGGTGAPAVAAPVGSLYLRYDGAAGSTLYVKESGTGTTGWTAK